MKYTIALLGLGTILLTSCETAPVPVRVGIDCSLFRDQSFSEESKAWLRKQTPPEALNVDLDKVAKNTEVFRKNCH